MEVFVSLRSAEFRKVSDDGVAGRGEQGDLSAAMEILEEVEGDEGAGRRVTTVRRPAANILDLRNEDA